MYLTSSTISIIGLIAMGTALITLGIMFYLIVRRKLKARASRKKTIIPKNEKKDFLYPDGTDYDSITMSQKSPGVARPKIEEPEQV
jgi:hypothetical protein